MIATANRRVIVISVFGFHHSRIKEDMLFRRSAVIAMVIFTLAACGCIRDGSISPRPVPESIPSETGQASAATGEPFSRNSQLSKEFINNRDGARMVYIPEGEFLMGSPDGEGRDDNRPQHKVYLDAYHIYQCEVTSGQFEHFVEETGYQPQVGFRRYAVPEREGHPVVEVTWNDAEAYCRWAGGRLPTEAEWEKAARGTDGRRYPWGDIWDKSKCNWYKSPRFAGMADMCEGRGTLPSGTFPEGASLYGCMDMAGNVWEWCLDWYDADYYRAGITQNPAGPSSGEFRVVRGGSWFDDNSFILCCYVRVGIQPEAWDDNYGFRVCFPCNKK